MPTIEAWGPDNPAGQQATSKTNEIGAEKLAQELVGEKSRCLVKMKIWSQKAEAKGFIPKTSLLQRAVVLSMIHGGEPPEGLKREPEVSKARAEILVMIRQWAKELGGFTVTLKQDREIVMTAVHNAEPPEGIADSVLVRSPKNPKVKVPVKQAIAEGADVKTKQETKDSKKRELMAKARDDKKKEEAAAAGAPEAASEQPPAEEEIPAAPSQSEAVETAQTAMESLESGQPASAQNPPAADTTPAASTNDATETPAPQAPEETLDSDAGGGDDGKVVVD